jgi:Peptidase family M3
MPQAQREMEMLKAYRRREAGRASDAPLAAWDRAYYMGMAKAEECDISGAALSQYFYLPNCVEGLGKLLQELMGVSMKAVPLDAGPRPHWGTGEKHAGKHQAGWTIPEPSACAPDTTVTPATFAVVPGCTAGKPGSAEASTPALVAQEGHCPHNWFC